MALDGNGPKEMAGVEPLPMAFQYATIVDRLEQQKNQLPDNERLSFRPTVLFTDFDKSYYWPDHHDEAVKVATLAEKFAIPIVVVSGNSYEDMVQKIGQINASHPDNPLPWPDVIAGAIGTEIYIRRQTADGSIKYERDDSFSQQITATGFDSQALSRSAAAAIEKGKLKQWSFEPQPIKPLPFKLSFFTMATEAEREQMLKDLEVVFPTAPVISVAEQVEFHQAHEEEITKGGKRRYCIDFIPVEPKRFATDYLIKILGIKRSFAVGDGGNDVNLIRNTLANVGIITGGATQQLQNEGLAEVPPQTQNFTGEFRKLRPGKRIFVATQAVAGSILEAAGKYLKIIRKIDHSPLIDQMLSDLEN